MFLYFKSSVNLNTFISLTYPLNSFANAKIFGIASGSSAIIVVENSKDIKLKERLENKYQNVDVIIPEENLGNGGGINVGLHMRL